MNLNQPFSILITIQHITMTHSLVDCFKFQGTMMSAQGCDWFPLINYPSNCTKIVEAITIMPQ